MEKRGISLKKLNIILIVAVCLLSLAAVGIAVYTMNSFQKMRMDTERYISSEQDASRIQAGSDYLTEQVRSFVITGDPVWVENYFEEAEVARRRDTALENLEQYFSGTDTYRLFSEALDTSNELMHREYYAMRLAIDGFGSDLSSYPVLLQELSLNEEDMGLSAQQKLEKARNMVFDAEYQSYKSRISGNIDLCVARITDELHQEQMKSTEHMQTLLWFLLVLEILLVGSTIALVLFASNLLLKPLWQIIVHVRNRELMPETGSEELRYLARVYNENLEQQQRDQDQLSYEASHDSLTGLYNRSAFDKFCASGTLGDYALLIVDLDHFKAINDTYGHDVGDAALKKVSAVLQTCFRAEDYICRIGGDEFAVIMVHAHSELRSLVENKIRQANEKLGCPEDGVPALSVSVGVAFPDRADPGEDIFKDADTALYRVKQSGKKGCGFY